MKFYEISAPFGDNTYTFGIHWKLLVELEEKIGPVYAAYNSFLTHKAMPVTHLREIIRLGLIGGGMKPTDALTMLERYVEGYPIIDNLPLAFSILEAAIFGNDEYRADLATKLVDATSAEPAMLADQQMAFKAALGQPASDEV